MIRKNLYIFCNIALIISAVISGLSFVAQKYGMSYVGPLTFNALRCFIGAVSLFPLVFFSFKKHLNMKILLKGGVLSGLVLFIAFTVNQYCMIFADAGKAGFITSLYILFVPLIGIFLKRKLTTNVSISVLIALIGLYLLCAKDSFQFGLCDIFLLVSAFFFGLHIIVVSHYSKKTDVIKLAILQFLTAGILSLPFMFLLEEPTLDIILEGWKPIIFIGVVVTAGAYTLQIFGHKATKPVLATLILSSEAVFAVIAGMVFLDERLSVREILGCIIMMIAIILSQIKNKGVLNEKQNR